MNKKTKKILLRLAMILAGALCSFLLIFAIYKKVSPEVFYNDEQRAQAALQALVGGQEVTPVTDKELVKNVSELYGAADGSYIVQTSTMGLEGDIVMRVGVAPDGTVSGLDCVSNNETPELGGKALKKDYLRTYIGKDSSEGIDSYTGATITSNAICRAVEVALKQYRVCSGLEPAEIEKPASAPAEGKAFEVSAKGFGGDVVLNVSIASDGTVAGIEVVSNNETPGVGGMALTPEYLDNYIGTASAEDIDAYSGASFTTAAIKECVGKALTQFKTGGNTNAIYEVTAQGFGGYLVLAVSIAPDGTVADIDVISSSETPAVGGIALEQNYLSNYYGANSADDVDAYTGATFTTTAIKECVNKALEQFNAGENAEAPAAEAPAAAAKTDKVYEETGKGFDGYVLLAVSIAPDGTVSNIEVISENENEKIGGMALNEDYFSKFYGLSSTEGIDGFTGASFTSAAIKECVDKALAKFNAASAPVEEAAPAEGGEAVYEVSAKGFGGDVVLNVTVAPDGTVSDIEVVSNSETPALGGMALKEDYLSTYYGANSVDGIDGYTGASFTTAAIKECVANALEQAKSADSKSEGGDAVYEVTAKGFGGDVVLKITIASDGTVSDIEVVSNSETPALGGMALKDDYLSTYYGANSVDGIDGYTGASFTTAAIKECVANALEQAKSADSKSEGGDAVYEVTAKGFGGDVVLKITIASDGTVSDIEVVSNSETPALGGMALKDDYLSTYYGTNSVDGIDGYTGASFTTAAIKECVANALEQFKAAK